MVVVAISYLLIFRDGLGECIGLCWGGPVCDRLSDCGPFFESPEYGADGVFDQCSEYVDDLHTSSDF